MDKELEIARALKKRRKELHLTQAEVAERANLTQKTVSRSENGKDHGSFISILTLAEALQLQIELKAVQVA